MKHQYLVLSLAALAWSSPALADSFSYDFSEPGSDPAANFEEECLGEDLDAEAVQACDARAAIMEAELLSHLITLEGDDDPESVALFQEVLELDSPALQAVAVQYLARTDNAPSGFVDSVKTFFFGGEPQLGATAAEVLAVGSDEDDEALGDLYSEQRNASDYGPLYGSDDQRLAVACLKDARLNLMSSFAQDEQFAPAERLLMYDRFAFDFSDTTADYPITAFVTDASLDDVTDHFTALFGKAPYPPAAESQAKLNAITEEMVALQIDALNGDQAAIEKMQELGEQMAELQEGVTVASRLQLPAFHAGNDVFWAGGDTDDVTGPLPRAVSVGEDERLGRVVIRYLNGVVGEVNVPDDEDPDAENPDEDSPDAGGKPNGEDEPSDEDNDDNGKGDEPAASSDDSGCSVSAPNSPRETSGGGLALLLTATVGLLRRLRAR
jgi:hypothetical protein